jgi:hypothetical protein
MVSKLFLIIQLLKRLRSSARAVPVGLALVSVIDFIRSLIFKKEMNLIYLKLIVLIYCPLI